MSVSEIHLKNLTKLKQRIMATYTCRICGINKNDTLNSQLNTSITCIPSESTKDVGFHGWDKVSEEDLRLDEM